MYVLKLKKLCKDKKITLTELALRSGIPQPSLSRYVTGKSDITLRQLSRLSETLGVDIEDILERKESFTKKYSHAIYVREKSEQKKEKKWISELLWTLRGHYLKIKRNKK